MKKTDLVELEKLKVERKRRDINLLKASNSKLYDVKLEEKVFRNRDCVDYLKKEVTKSASRILHVKSGVAITDAINRVEEQKSLTEIRSQFLPKLNKSKSTRTFTKKLSFIDKPEPMPRDLRRAIPSTMEASGGPASPPKFAPFFVTQPPAAAEIQDSLYENAAHHSQFNTQEKTQLTEDMMSMEEGGEYKDVAISAKVHAAHLELQTNSLFDSERAFARISHKMKS